jgi:hypothetical protein
MGFVYGALKDLVKWIYKAFRKADPAETILLRQKWKEEIKSNLRWIDKEMGYGEAIIRDVRRVDTYPKIEDHAKGISPWFRVALLNMYHKGIEVGLRYYPLKYDKDQRSWRHYNRDKEKYDVNALLIGRIPFERIVNIDWQGDEYYFIPHIYCRFSSKTKEPYEELVYSIRKGSDESQYYEEIASYDDVRKASRNK